MRRVASVDEWLQAKQYLSANALCTRILAPPTLRASNEDGRKLLVRADTQPLHLTGIQKRRRDPHP